jgi:hypothetical protein
MEMSLHMTKAAGLLPICAVLLWAASQPWKTGDPKEWTSQDVDHVLTNSPWAQSASASFALAEDNTAPLPPAIDVPQAGMPSPRNAATDGRWDGGVSRVNRNGPPTLDVTVRWNTALPVRQAFERKRSGPRYSPEQVRKDYIITVIGLVPAGRYVQPQMRTSSSDGLEDVRNPEEMLEGVMRYSFLFPRGKSSIHPEDAKLDTSTGTLHIFFPRTQAIDAGDKEVTFQMRFGSLSVVKKFRLKDMMYRGQLEL